MVGKLLELLVGSRAVGNGLGHLGLRLLELALENGDPVGQRHFKRAVGLLPRLAERGGL